MNSERVLNAAVTLHEVCSATPLVAQFLPSGALFALRHGPTLINQFLPGPLDDGLFRLLLRWRNPSQSSFQWTPLVGPRTSFSVSPEGARWTTSATGIACTTHLELHADQPAWRWRITLRNESDAPVLCDILHGQDLGLADEGAVRNNEAYTSQYIDLLPLSDAELGWVIFARQNQTMAQGRHPWLAAACVQGAAEFCTDGLQFFGEDHRLAQIPLAVRAERLESRRKQGEFAFAGLQSRWTKLAPGETNETTFVVRFLEDHPTTSSETDLAFVREIAGSAASGRFPIFTGSALPHASPSRSLFTNGAWLHGEIPSTSDWDEWFPGTRRFEERSPNDTLQSFFHGVNTHVVSREKEAAIARPHGHILRSGDGLWFDPNHFGLTCYASGIFAAQAYYGHPSFARLLSVVRNALNVPRASGQRVFVRRGDQWQQLGVSSAFAMTPSDARWIYKVDGGLIELRAFCANDRAFAGLDIRVRQGPPMEFLISHELVVGAIEFEHPGQIETFVDEAWFGCRPQAESLVGRYQSDIGFAIAAAEAETIAAMGGSELLSDTDESGNGPYVVFRTREVTGAKFLLIGSGSGDRTLAEEVKAARGWVSAKSPPTGAPLISPVKLWGGDERAVQRVNEILPWFAHNAAIHFSAPHGLEQYGGAAWGVRDVCQGSVEWLLASRQFGVVRRILEVVFAQQYATDGGWPQWFMFPPYRFIQQAHSHGDVCFWPVKALCDYVEASGDIDFLNTRFGYTDPKQFVETGPNETVLQHCERVIAQCEARFIRGTALVNYGDGDWDDTLQPADPALRTRMVSAWTVGLAFHAFRQLAAVCRRAQAQSVATRLEGLCTRMQQDFAAQLMPDGVVAGFMVFEPNGTKRPLLHPQDAVTRIRYRLLPMTRSILAELSTPEEAKRHLGIIAQDLRYPDGVRLMSEPTPYLGGVERLFKRAETAANVGREIGLQYVHAHLRYAEALAKVGHADELWWALQAVNPVDIQSVVPNAGPRQSNVYFSSSDADFSDRYEAERRWSELRDGRVAVQGGWRLYSSGPGLFLHKVRACLLGLRESFDDIVFDPVLPTLLDNLAAEANLGGKSIEVRYHVNDRMHTPRRIVVNGVEVSCTRLESNPYRTGGVLVRFGELNGLLRESKNVIEIEL